jgi:hypothetical protein
MAKSKHRIEKAVEGNSCSLISSTILPLDTPTKKNHNNPHSELPLSRLILELTTTVTQSRNAERCQSVNNSENRLAVKNVGCHRTANTSSP